MDGHDIFFWQKLETELITKIPSHIKNCLHLCTLGRPITIRNIDENAIGAVEVFIQNDLKEISKNWHDEAGNSLDKSIFIGSFHDEHIQFKFTVGERILMKEIGEYVKTVTNTIGLQFFKQKNNKNTNFDETIYIPDVGRFFIKTAPTKEEIVAPINANDTVNTDDLDKKHKTDIYEKVIRLLRLSGIGEQDLENFNVENISIERKNGRLIAGKIKCIVCSDTKNINAKEVNNTIYWITSNFQKHLVNVHKLQVAEKDAVPQKTAKRKCVPQTTTKCPVLSQDNMVHDTSEFETSVSLQILPATIGVEKMEQNMYSQISTQNLLMYNSYIQNEEATEEIEYFIGEQFFPLQVVPIAPDGNCIFGALAHQIFQNKVSSGKHNADVRKLRIDVVEFIKSNIECFEHVLKGRIYEKKDKKAATDAKSITIENFEEECNDLLANLSRNGVWCGSETIQAVSMLFEVNILIVNENGCISYANGFNPNLKKTIMIAYRLSVSQSSTGANWNHYDSVANINAENIIVIAEHLAINHKNERNDIIIHVSSGNFHYFLSYSSSLDSSF